LVLPVKALVALLRLPQVYVIVVLEEKKLIDQLGMKWVYPSLQHHIASSYSV